MQISENGLAMIRQWEGCELDAYQDGGGTWTIGYGTTCYPDGKPVREGDVWTQEQADDALASDAVSIAQDPVNTLVTVPLSQKPVRLARRLYLQPRRGGIYRELDTPRDAERRAITLARRRSFRAGTRSTASHRRA